VWVGVSSEIERRNADRRQTGSETQRCLGNCVWWLVWWRRCKGCLLSARIRVCLFIYRMIKPETLQKNMIKTLKKEIRIRKYV